MFSKFITNKVIQYYIVAIKLLPYIMLTLGRKGEGVLVWNAPFGFFKHFSMIIVCGHLPISVAIPLCLRHIYCEFGENRLLNIGDLNDKSGLV